MNTNVNEAIETWNAEHAAATTELEALEATLKADYNKYLDSLAAYVARVKAANDVRQSFYRTLQIEDVTNGTDNGIHSTASQFTHGAIDPIKNRAAAYILDNGNDRATHSIHIVNSCDSDKILCRKQP